MGKAEKRDELEDKRKSNQKKLRKLGEDLSELQSYYKKEQTKLKEKTASYDAKLKKIDDRLKGI